MAHGQNKYRQHGGESYLVVKGFENGKQESHFEISCGKCNAVGVVGNYKDMRLPPEAVHGLFRKLGWVVHPRKITAHRCPECQIHPESQQEKISIMAAQVATLNPRQLSGYEIRTVSGLLNDHFDEGLGRFENGWDDDRVAKQANVPRASVTRLREEGWGKIKVFADIESLKSEIGSVKQMLADLEARVVAAEKTRLA